VGRILAMRREELALEQTDIAKNVGVSQSTWSRIERGESAFTVDQLGKAARALGASPGQLLQQADDAAAGLAELNVIIEPERPSRSTETALTLIGAAVLGFLIAKALSK